MARVKGQSNKKTSTSVSKKGSSQNKKDSKRESKIKARIEQEQNKTMLEALAKVNNKKNRYTVSKHAIQELKNPDLVYILGGSNGGQYTYIHSHKKTWSTGLRTAEMAMNKMLKDLFDEQKLVIQKRIAQINNLWETQVYEPINRAEKQLGNNVRIKNWEDFKQYYEGLAQIGQSANLTSVIKYKIASSAASALHYYYGRETYEDYLGRLLYMGVINEGTLKKLLLKEIDIQTKISSLNKIFEKEADKRRKLFVQDDRVADWANSFSKNATTRSNYFQASADFKPDSKQLGKITEYELSTKTEDAIVKAHQKDIIDAFANNLFHIVSSNMGMSKGVYHTLASGESYHQKGGLDNKINKADLVVSIPVGDIVINIPSSVKLSVKVESIEQNGKFTTIQTDDLLSATASSANLDFDDINAHVGSDSYKNNRSKIHSLIRYVYNNAAAIPSDNMNNFTRFNNSIIYYLAWLDLCIKIVGNPAEGHEEQLAIALESIRSIHNTADVLERLVDITPAGIKDFMTVMSNPADHLTYSSYSAVQYLQLEIDLLIGRLWRDFLDKNGRQPDYKLIYGRAFSILSRHSSVTKKKIPGASVMYRIKMNNMRTLTI